MAKSSPKVRAAKPKNAFFRPLKAELKDLFKALSKGIGHTVAGKWEELGTDTVEALSAIGLATEPGELAYLLIRRSLTAAVFDLVGESATLPLTGGAPDADSFLEDMDPAVALGDIQIDRRFFDRPGELSIVSEVQTMLRKWLEAHGLEKPQARAIAERMKSYFLYALNREWQRNAKSYKALMEAVDTPFARAGDREWAWAGYAAMLQRQVDEGIFGEAFSLGQLYIPVNAWYYDEPPDRMGRSEVKPVRVVITLRQELEQWLQEAGPIDAIRVISGGPGSGKSSFVRIFAARVANEGKWRVLFVPLHLIDPAKDLVDEVGSFARTNGLLQNPVDPDSPEPNLLLIFDGLDELAGQGKASAETARAFVREVERTVERRQNVRLRVLISGRELVIQENESEFRRRRQILNLLPYFVPDRDQYKDPGKLLQADLRNDWWKRYGRLTGKSYHGLPDQLNRDDLHEITAQPLLNYLLSLTYSRKKLDFSQDINLNLIYDDLVKAVHERGYEKHRPWAPIRHMTLEEFSRVLEEIGLAAWHGDGRTTSVREIEEHCKANGVSRLIEVFQEGAAAGVTRLLAAFFFRQYGRRASGDPTFVFTHKSFGEYLAARRVVREMAKVVKESDRRAQNLDEGWDEREALKHWAQVCGPTPMSQYLHSFLLNEIKLRSADEIPNWQARFAKPFGYILRQGMPMEQLALPTFAEAMRLSRNAEEALVAALNACARVTEKVSVIEYPNFTAFGTWFKRIQGQRESGKNPLVASCLSFTDFSGVILDMSDLYGANLSHALLRRTAAFYVNFMSTDLSGADVAEATFKGANFRMPTLREST
jgi:hypothetical protein